MSGAEPTGSRDPGAIRVSVRCGVGMPPAWRALSDPADLARWFGVVDRPWREGRPGRIDFGDGDFFDVTTRRVVDQRCIEFDWRFLGLGATARVRWTTTVVPEGVEILVEDRAPGRTAAEEDQLLAGWTDFLSRLARYLSTGEPARYDLRDVIDGSVDVPASGVDLLELSTLYQWLPIATDGFRPRWFFIVDDEGPRRFEIDGWHGRSDRAMFLVSIPGTVEPTRCAVWFEHAPRAGRLLFSHAGWGRLNLPDQRALLLRRRFVATWVAALEHAHHLSQRH